ncbi:MAG: hypothetical protein P0120_20315 [Nitrospira sp.]|nr:hypothetical protein [Nitrospira sp.]
MTIDGFMMVNLNNRDFIPNSGERPRQGDTISTAFVESTVTHVVKRQEKYRESFFDMTMLENKRENKRGRESLFDRQEKYEEVGGAPS